MLINTLLALPRCFRLSMHFNDDDDNGQRWQWWWQYCGRHHHASYIFFYIHISRPRLYAVPCLPFRRDWCVCAHARSRPMAKHGRR